MKHGSFTWLGFAIAQWPVSRTRETGKNCIIIFHGLTLVTKEYCFHFCLKQVPYVVRGVSMSCKMSKQGGIDAEANPGNHGSVGFPLTMIICFPLLLDAINS